MPHRRTSASLPAQHSMQLERMTRSSGLLGVASASSCGTVSRRELPFDAGRLHQPVGAD
jgi:hypothetical protein